MEPYKMRGMVSKISEVKVISEKFSVVEFILHMDDGKYPNDVKFQLTNDNIQMINQQMINQKAEVSFYINGRGTERGYFNNLTAVGVAVAQQPSAYTPPAYQQPQPPAQPPPSAGGFGNHDTPPGAIDNSAIEDGVPF